VKGKFFLVCLISEVSPVQKPEEKAIREIEAGSGDEAGVVYGDSSQKEP
jgi:hypothetical protein